MPVLPARLPFRLLPLLLVMLIIGAHTARADSRFDLIQLQAASSHFASHVWGGNFRAPNGRDFNMTHYYEAQNPLFHARGTLAIARGKGAYWLVPGLVDAGYRATLYRAEPTLRLGFGTSWQTGPLSMLSVIADNILATGGDVSERACSDKYGRRYHCGTGLTWTDYQTDSTSQRQNDAAMPKLRMKFVSRF